MRPTTVIAFYTFSLLVAAAAVEAQQSAQPKRIGFASIGAPATSGPFVTDLREGLREHGWVDGQNIVIEARYGAGKLERFAQIAAELVQLPVDVLVTAGVPPTLALKKATQTIPIVVAAATDPAGTGLVTPGGNVAAFDVLPADAPAKQLEVLREAVPGLSHVAVVWNDSNPGSQLNARRVREAAQGAGLHVIPIDVQDPDQLETALSSLRDKGAQAIFVVADPRFLAQRRRIGQLTTATGLPSICQERDYVDGGCMLAYGANIRSMYRQAASYVDRILKGTRPASLPIGPPTRFELAVHAGSAKAMGFTIPPAVLKRADAVVQ
jgi:putative tryptophan/tyrosine transport system substrate-binding protein